MFDKKITKQNYLFIGIIILFFSNCTYDKKEDSLPQTLNTACFPDDVGNIFVTKCATSGCHNTISKDGAAGLDMSSWTTLFNGTRNGSAIIPYRADQSFLVNFVNTYSDLGNTQLPVMPNNGTPLSRDEVKTIINWINNGAPDCNGKKFTDNPDRRKFYISNQGCDLVSVWDADKKVIMRYVDVGANPALIEVPHCIKISPDGKFWYVSFVSGSKFQKYKTSDDSFVGQVDITVGSWNTFAFSPDSKWAYIIDFNNSRVAYVDCENMMLKPGTPFNPEPGTFSAPHGSAVSPDGNYLYITMQLGNQLYKMDITSFPPDGHYINLPGTILSHPHEISFSPDGNLYFVTCEDADAVEVFNAHTDAFLKSIPTALEPEEMSFSLSNNYLFVSCPEGNSVSIINYVDTVLVKTINVGYVPHGIVVDDVQGLCYVANRNLSTAGGPPPHHTSDCGGRNGYLVAIDMNTLNLVPGFKPELSVDPYVMTIRK